MPSLEKPPPAPSPGTLLAGKYRVERVLGYGGMGLVLAAMHLQLDHRVALKLLRPELARDLEFLARFLREGRAAVKIRSEHVARVLDVGTLEDGAPFMVLEYLEGRDLGEVLAGDGPLSLARGIDLVLQACEALAEAHELGIIHRDLKPSNFFLTSRPDGTDCVKLLDFGISKVTGSTGPLAEHAKTQTRSALGSPAYMSPEQLRNSRDVDVRTDLWSLGVSLHELLTGSLPFTGNTAAELGGAVLHVAASPLRVTRPDAPPGLEAIVARCLSKDPALRFQTVAELANVLAPFGSSAARTSAERISKIQRASAILSEAPGRVVTQPLNLAQALDPALASTTPQQTATAWNRSGRTATSRSGRLVAALGTVLALAVLAGVLWLRGGRAGVNAPHAIPAPLTQPDARSSAAASLASSLPTPSTTAPIPLASADAPAAPSAATAQPVAATRSKSEPTQRLPRRVPTTPLPEPTPTQPAPLPIPSGMTAVRK